jgi:Protein of unknown function (DUF3309)
MRISVCAYVEPRDSRFERPGLARTLQNKEELSRPPRGSYLNEPVDKASLNNCAQSPRRRPTNYTEVVMGTLLLIILILLLVGGIPAWPYSRGWGYGPSGVVGLLVVVLLFLLIFEQVPWGWRY